MRFRHGLTGAMLAEARKNEREAGPVEERVDALPLLLVQHRIHHRGQAYVQSRHAGTVPSQADGFHLEFERAPPVGGLLEMIALKLNSV